MVENPSGNVRLADLELVKQMQERTPDGRLTPGADAAFRLLYARHQETVFTSMYVMIGDVEVAKEITLAAFGSALIAVAEMLPAKPFDRWVVDLAKQEWRRRRPPRSRVASLDALVEQSGESIEWQTLQTGLLRTVTSVQQRELMEEAVKRLSRQEFRVFMLHYLGFSNEEIADALDVESVTSITMTLWRAHARCREFKQQYEQDALPPPPKKRAMEQPPGTARRGRKPGKAPATTKTRKGGLKE